MSNEPHSIQFVPSRVNSTVCPPSCPPGSALTRTDASGSGLSKKRETPPVLDAQIVLQDASAQLLAGRGS